MYGYFKATNKFYQRKFHQKDIDFVVAKLSITLPESDAEYKRRTYLNHRETILAYTGCKKFDKTAISLLTDTLTPMIRSHTRPKLILQQVCDFLITHKIEIPTYYTLCAIISNEIKKQQEKLNQTIVKGLTKERKTLLDGLLSKEEGSRYRMTLLKRFSHSTKPAKIKSNIADLIVLQELFQAIEPVIALLQLTNEGMKYYAYSAIKFDIFQMVRRSDTDKYLYLLAFIMHQYYTLQDLLIDVFIQSVVTAENHTNKQQKEAAFVERKTRSKTIERVISSFLSAKQRIKQAQSVLNAALPDKEKIQELQKLFSGKTELEEQELEVKVVQLQKETNRILADEDYYDTLETQSIKLQNRVSEIIKYLQFHESTSNKHIITAITYFKQKDGVLVNTAPVDFLEAKEQEILFDEQGKLRISLYKILLFTSIVLLVKAGGLNLSYSYRYRSFDAYLISKERWDAQKELLLQQAELNGFQDFPKLIRQLEVELHKQYELTNKHILDGTNKHIKFYKDGSFSLITPKKEEDEEEENVIADLFPKSRFVSLGEVLATVQNATGFLDDFSHWQTTHVSSKPTPKTFYAGIIGLGCNIGIKKLSRISTNINTSELDTAVNWYFTPDNIMAANDAILAFIDTLTLPKLFKKDQTRMHTSSDGQKYSVAKDSLNVNHSFKYFGRGKGVTVNSFIDESHRLFFSTVSSSSER